MVQVVEPWGCLVSVFVVTCACNACLLQVEGPKSRVVDLCAGRVMGVWTECVKMKVPPRKVGLKPQETMCWGVCLPSSQVSVRLSLGPQSQGHLMLGCVSAQLIPLHEGTFVGLRVREGICKGVSVKL